VSADQVVVLAALSGIGMFFVGLFVGWLSWSGNPWRDAYVRQYENAVRDKNTASNDLTSALRREDDAKSALREIIALAQEELGE